MGEKQERVIDIVLLAISVVCGPIIWMFALGFARVAWWQGNDDLTLVYSLAVSYILMRWAVRGVLEGPERVPRWLFLFASVFNAYEAFERTVSELPDRYLYVALLLGYSLWQFIVFRPFERSRS